MDALTSFAGRHSQQSGRALDWRSCQEFGKAAAKLLAPDFHDYLLQAAASLVPNSVLLLSMLHYSRFAPPDFFAHQDYAPDFVTIYNRELYRYDPYYRYWKEGGEPGVKPMTRILKNVNRRKQYINAVLAKANITDEICIILPPVGNCCLALFIDRCGGKFSKSEVSRLEAIYPLIIGLQEAHVASLSSSIWIEGNDASNALPSARPIRILDREHSEVFKNQAWQEFTEKEGQDLASTIECLPAAGHGQVMLRGNLVLHRAALPATFGLAPGGWIEMIEPLGRTPRHPDQFSLPQYLADLLTPRETEIVALILHGYPSMSIAEKLGVSRGTVKNHRLRLYEKLDITSERELFLRCVVPEGEQL